MIKRIIIKKEKDGIYIVNDKSYSVGFKTSDNKLFLEEKNALRHEIKINNQNGDNAA